MAESPVLLKDILTLLDRIAAFELAESWDNVGLMVGDEQQEIGGIMIGLDPTEALLDEALAAGANCLVTHHPLIFKPIKSLPSAGPLGRFLRKALRHDIAVVGCHTNLDLVPGGVSEVLARQIGLVDTRPLLAKNPVTGPALGFGRIGRLPEPESGAEFIPRLLAALQLAGVQVAGVLPERIESVAVCGGSGSDLAEAAWAAGAQVYLTGELKHSTARWVEESGFCAIDGGHFATENGVVKVLAHLLREAASDHGLPLAIQVSQNQGNPFTWYGCGT